MSQKIASRLHQLACKTAVEKEVNNPHKQEKFMETWMRRNQPKIRHTVYLQQINILAQTEMIS